MDDKKQLFQHGLLYQSRYDIVIKLTPIIKTGDIFVRCGNENIMGIPFSRLTAKLTDSEWSHATIAIKENNEIWMVEVNDRGTQKCRLIDWIDYCTSGAFEVFRLKNMTLLEESNIWEAAYNFLKEDPDYDFTFNNDSKFYCTESVVEIYRRAGIVLVEPKFLKELVSSFNYSILVPINWFIGRFCEKSIPLDLPLYVVGNKDKGILSCPRLEFTIRLDIKNLSVKFGNYMNYYMYSRKR